jgi:hypothetical protein
MTNRIDANSLLLCREEHDSCSIAKQEPPKSSEYTQEDCFICLRPMLMREAIGHKWPPSSPQDDGKFSCHQLHRECLLNLLKSDTNSSIYCGMCKLFMGGKEYDHDTIKTSDPELAEAFESAKNRHIQKENESLRLSGIRLRLFGRTIYTNRWWVLLFILLVAAGCYLAWAIPASFVLPWLISKTAGLTLWLGTALVCVSFYPFLVIFWKILDHCLHF